MSEQQPQLTETDMRRALTAMGIEMMDDPRPTREIAIQYGVIAVEGTLETEQDMAPVEIPRSAMVNRSARGDSPYFVK